MPTRLGLPPAWIVFKQEVQGLPERQGMIVDEADVLEEASEQLQLQLLAEQTKWWEQAKWDLRERLEKGDKKMKEKYSLQVAGEKLVFNLQPGE